MLNDYEEKTITPTSTMVCIVLAFVAMFALGALFGHRLATSGQTPW